MFRRNSASAKPRDDHDYPVVQSFDTADDADDESRGSLWKTIALLILISLLWIGVVAVIVWLFQPATAQGAMTPTLLTVRCMAYRFRP